MTTKYERVKQTGAQHIVATVKSTWWTMIVAALMTGLIAAILVEGYGALATGSLAVPQAQTHVFAAAFALACAYGAAVTVLLRGVIATLVASIEWVADEVEKLTDGIVHQAETVLGGPGGHYAAREVVGSDSGAR